VPGGASSWAGTSAASAAPIRWKMASACRDQADNRVGGPPAERNPAREKQHGQ
jgi:hypothetical protein